MSTIEELIRSRHREQFYDYYRSLGYDERLAVILSLFTYGFFRYRDMSLDDLYESLIEEKHYLPAEMVEERNSLLERRRLDGLRFLKASPRPDEGREPLAGFAESGLADSAPKPTDFSIETGELQHSLAAAMFEEEALAMRPRPLLRRGAKPRRGG